MRKFFVLLLPLLGISCTKFASYKPAPADPAAFFKSQGSFCTVETGGQPVASSVDRFAEVFVFGQDNSLKIHGFDVDEDSLLQFNSKGQPKLKEVEKATFRVNGEKLMFKTDGANREREAGFKRVNRTLDGRNLECFELLSGPASSVHCGCALPEKN